MINSQWRKFLNDQVIVEYESDDGIVVLNKAAGILAHPNNERQASKNALFTCSYSLKQQAYFANTKPIIYLLNRLDSPVSGLILVGLNSDIAKSIQSAFQEKTITKKYLALLKGHLPYKTGIWQSKILKVKHNNTVRASLNGENVAITRYHVLESFMWRSITLSLVELQPITGRTHQLRIHCAQNKSPIVGDKIYGDFTFNKKFSEITYQKSLLLHSDFVDIKYHFAGSLKSFKVKSSYDLKKTCIKLLTL